MSELQFPFQKNYLQRLGSVDSELNKCWRPLPLDRRTLGRKFAGAMGYSTILLDLIRCIIKRIYLLSHSATEKISARPF